MVKPDAARLAQLAEAVLEVKFQIPVAQQFSLAETGAAQKAAKQGGAGGKLLIVP